MSACSRKNVICLLIPLILTAFLAFSCGNTSPEIEKIKNANNQQLINMLRNGNLSERRKVSALLRNNVKIENKQAFSVVLSSDEDDIVAGNCALALAKIGDEESIRILSECVQSFTGFRAKACASALVSQVVTEEIITEIEMLIAKKPQMLITFIQGLRLNNNNSVFNFHNKILMDYEKYPVNVTIAVIDKVGCITDKNSLPKLYDIYYNAKNAELRTKAEHAIECFPEKIRHEFGQKHDEILKEKARLRAEELRMKEIKKTRRLEKLKPPVPYEKMQENVKIRGAIIVEKLEIAKDYATKGHPGGFNGQANEGELLAYNVQIKNLSALNFNQLSGYCYSYTDSVIVLNRRIFFRKVSGESSQVSENQLMLLISPDTKPGEKIELFFQFGESKSGEREFVIYSKAEIEIMPLPFGTFTFSVSDFDDDQWGLSEGNGDGVLQWGEKCEMLVNIQNMGNKDVEFAQLEIVSLNPQARLDKNRLIVGEINKDSEDGASVVISVSLSSEYDGRYDMQLFLKLNVIENKKISGSWIQLLQITVGERSPKLLGKVYSYKHFDVNNLIDIFVVQQNNQDLQELFLFNTEVDFIDAKSLLILETE